MIGDCWIKRGCWENSSAPPDSPGGYTNYVDADDGEAYDFEMSANAVDKDGVEHVVYWLFEGVKGDADRALDSRRTE